MSGDWSSIDRARFRRVVSQIGPREMARRIPSALSTVYSILEGVTQRPSNAVRAGIARVIEQQEQTREEPAQRDP